jgi:hypothetical protein
METAPVPRSLRLLIGLASFVVIVAAFRTAGTLPIPFLLTVFRYSQPRYRSPSLKKNHAKTPRRIPRARMIQI